MLTEENKVIDEALSLIWEYGGIDGAHHKQWLLDQLVRTLTVTEKEYDKWIDSYEVVNDDGEREYEWDEGIAP